jgi:glycosyltransferase involved in cell wall biosynthesis
VAEFRPDLVFATWAYPDGWAAGRLAREAGLPVVVLVHGSDVLLADRVPGRRRRTAEALRAADGVVAMSKDLADRVADLGVDRGRTLVNYSGIDPDVFRPGSKAEARAPLGLTVGDPHVLFVGNLVPVKAVDMLLRASAALVGSGFPVRVTVVGQGPLRPALERLAGELGLGDRVAFAGPKPQAELAAWYRAADAVCLPSLSEGVPNVLLEASACGTPWVATAVGGVPEIADLGASRLVPPGAPAELAAALREVLTKPPAPPGRAVPTREESVAELEAWLEQVVKTAGR